MKLIDKFSDPETIYGGVPSWVYGVAWSLFWTLICFAAMLFVGEPFWPIAGLAVALVQFGVTMWVCRA